MDTVPLNFSQRVLAMRKCCESERCFCDHSLFVASKWNQTEKTKIQRLMLCLAFVDRKWRHGFYECGGSDEALALDDLVRLPNVKKNVRVCRIVFMRDGNYHHNVADMKKLLEVVSFLSNETELCLQDARLLDFPGGELLSTWLQDTWFSCIRIVTLTSADIYRKVLEKQFSRRKPTLVTVRQIRGNEHFLAERLMSGDLRHLEIYDKDFRFPATVLEQIVRNVTNNPEDYRKNNLEITARFKGPKKDLMDRMTKIKNREKAYNICI